MLDPALIPKPHKRAIRPYIWVLLLIIIVILGLLLFKLPVSASIQYSGEVFDAYWYRIITAPENGYGYFISQGNFWNEGGNHCGSGYGIAPNVEFNMSIYWYPYGGCDEGIWYIESFNEELEITGYWQLYANSQYNWGEIELKIWGISPESGTEIATMDTLITIGYQGFNWDEYKGFSVAFWDERLHASSNTKLFETDDLDPSGTGEVIINLSSFGIDRKGKWYLTALGFGSHLDIEGGMFLTTRGYVDFWTGELVSPEYYLFINIESLPDFYPVSSFDTWYAANVEEFATPTAMAMSMTNFMTPIFQTIGEFNDRTQEIFDTNEAYNRGFALGEIFPLISGYANSISIFFGGFPIVSFFKYIIILMFAIFLIKAILKFIPFFGK